MWTLPELAGFYVWTYGAPSAPLNCQPRYARSLGLRHTFCADAWSHSFDRRMVAGEIRASPGDVGIPWGTCSLAPLLLRPGNATPASGSVQALCQRYR